jgi:hypothetical protein
VSDVKYPKDPILLHLRETGRFLVDAYIEIDHTRNQVTDLRYSQAVGLLEEINHTSGLIASARGVIGDLIQTRINQINRDPTKDNDDG